MRNRSRAKETGYVEHLAFCVTVIKKFQYLKYEEANEVGVE